MAKNISSIGEFGLIDLIKKQIKLDKSVIKGIGDDTAVLPFGKDRYQLFTTDMLVEDVHFTRRQKPQDVGHKALACNISDIAAMGGVSTFAVVSLGLPKGLSAQYVEGLYQGIQALAKRFGVGVVGGDTVKSAQIVINIALLGEVKKKDLVLRSGAKSGDVIFVTGALGGSLKTGKHLTFMPQVEASRFLVKNFKPSAMMDLSDGLAGDLNHILRASDVGAELWPDDVPKTKGCTLQQALTDGEDFELLFTLSPKKAKKLLEWQQKNKQWYFYPVGKITANKKQLIPAKGYTHF